MHAIATNLMQSLLATGETPYFPLEAIVLLLAVVIVVGGFTVVVVGLQVVFLSGEYRAGSGDAGRVNKSRFRTTVAVLTWMLFLMCMAALVGFQRKPISRQPTY